MIGFLEPLLSEVEEIVKKVSLLGKDFSLLYDFVEPDKSSSQNLMILLENYRGFYINKRNLIIKNFLRFRIFMI